MTSPSGGNLKRSEEFKMSEIKEIKEYIERMSNNYRSRMGNPEDPNYWKTATNIEMYNYGRCVASMDILDFIELVVEKTKEKK